MRLTYRRECVKTTWTLRVLVISLVVVIAAVTRSWWLEALGAELVCQEEIRSADAILIDNLDQDYLLFERAESLYRAGIASTILVTVDATPGGEARPVERGIAGVMASVAHLEKMDLVPVQLREPITLNVALQVGRVLEQRHIESIVLVTPGFRSHRSNLVNDAVLSRKGITTACVPVFGNETVDSWHDTWHGVEIVTEQLGKLAYYRLYVLPFSAWTRQS